MSIAKFAHLNWVRGPIEKYIERAKQAMVNITELRDRIENPPVGAEPTWFRTQDDKLADNSTELKELLATIHAALDIIGSDGGRALTTELVTLAGVSADMPADAQARALISIQASLGIIPSYIDMVVGGAHDSQAVVLKYINELRSHRGVPELNDESALAVTAAFGFKAPPLYEADCDIEDRTAVFQKAALNFCTLYTEASRKENLSAWAEMREHLRQLQRVTNDPELGCYWWVGEAIIGVIIADNGFVPPAMTTALRVVMVATQRLPQGEESAKQMLSAGKFSSLLNALSISRKKTDTSNAVVAHFDIKQNVEEDRVRELQSQLVSHSVQTIADVLPEIQPRLESAMIAFGRAATARQHDSFVVQQKAFDQAMRTMANIFGIFNESELSEVSFQLADLMRGVESKEHLNEEIIDLVKSQILYMDSKLTLLRRNEVADLLQFSNVTADVIEKLVNESTSELNKITRIIATHIESGAGSEKLLTALAALRELANVYEFAGSEAIGNILSAIVSVFSEEVEGGVLEESDRISLAARALVAVEMYIQYISANLQPPATLIEAARNAVMELGFTTTEFVAVPQSQLLAKFNEQQEASANLDPLLQEIFDVRPTIEALHDAGKVSDPKSLYSFASACLLLSAAAQIKAELRFAELCRNASELAKVIPGRIDNPDFDIKAAHSLILKTSELLLRCMDEYSSRGKVNLFLIDAIQELANASGVSVSEHPSPEVEPQAATTPARELPDGYDPKLRELFTEEFAEQIQKLFDYLSGDDLSVTERECRAIHSIHGCSSSAGCVAISTLFDVLEARFYSLKATEQGITVDQAGALKGLLDEVVAYEKNFPWESGTNDLPRWLEVAGTITGEQAPDHDAAYETEPAEASHAPQETEPYFVAEESLLESQLQSLAALEAEVEIEAAVEAVTSKSVTQEVIKEPSLQVTSPVITTASFIDDSYDKEDLHELYVAEGEEVMPQLEQAITQWLGDMQSRAVQAEIRRHLHTLKGAAALIRAEGVRTLLHETESLFDAFVSGAITVEPHCADLTLLVKDELVRISESICNREGYPYSTALTDFIAHSCLDSNVAKEGVGQIRTTLYGAVEPVAAPAAETPSSNELPVDPELQAAVLEAEAVEPELEAEITTESNAGESVDVIDSDDVPSLGQQEPVKVGVAGTRRGSRAGSSRPHNTKRNENDFVPRSFFNAPAPIVQPEPELSDLKTEDKEVIPLLVSFMEGATNANKIKPVAKGTPKNLKVDLERLDTCMKHANEIKAGSYRQQGLQLGIQHSVTSLREKMTLMLMNAHKQTLQLRYFNNFHGENGVEAISENSPHEAQVHLERFNHLSHSHAQHLLQLEQVLQDTQDVLTQLSLLENNLAHQSDAVHQLHGDLTKARLLTFKSIEHNVDGAVKSAIKADRIPVKTETIGGDTAIDRVMLQAISNPLRHLATNAVVHGFESPEERQRLGKPATGKLTLKAVRMQKSVLIQISDDGRGIDPKVIYKKAIDMKLISPTDQLTESEIINLIKKDGFSTATTVTQSAGRGVGMDVVVREIAKVGGKLSISSVVGEGSTFSIELPLTVGADSALVSRLGGQWFAMPTYSLAHVLDYPTTDLMKVRAKPGVPQIMHENKSFDVVHLADLIAVPDFKVSSAQPPSHTCLALVERDGVRLAIEVGTDVSMPDISINQIEGILGNVTGITGSTEVHDGTPALVLDVVELARLNMNRTAKGYETKLYRIRRVKREARPLVLIVDDSSSYQKLLTRHFENLGMDVATAQNGQDALDKLQTLTTPTLFVLDVEMPRMNGLELTEALRKNRTFAETPIIMLTTKSGLGDTAMKLGVNQFLPKPYDATALTAAVHLVCPELGVYIQEHKPSAEVFA